MMTEPAAAAHAAVYEQVRSLLKEGTPESVDQAASLLQPLAEAGHTDAQIDLGFLLASGQTEVRDLPAAAGWFERAASSGSAEAQFNFGLLLRHGQGVAQDLDRAATMFREAARGGSADGAFNYAQLLRERSAAGPALAEAVDLLEQRADAEAGVKCAYAAGLAATEGWLGTPDIPRAVEFFKLAVEGGNLSATYNLALIYYYGQPGVPTDRAAARALFQRAANAGHEKAQQALGDPTGWSEG
jgi:uncharacterized protein